MQIIFELARAENAGDPYAFSFAAQKYLLRSGEGNYEEVDIAWSQALLDNIAALQIRGHDPAIEANLGDFMRRILRPVGWSYFEDAIIRAQQAGRLIHVVVRSAAAEVYALPWELIRLKSTGQSLGCMPGVILRYEWPGCMPSPPRERRRSERIVMGWSAAGGAVPAAEHIAAIRAACEPSGRAFSLDRDVIPHLSLDRLAAVLAEGERDNTPIERLHLLCHGAAAGSAFGLALDSSDGERVIVEPSRLQQVIARHTATLRVVVLAACNSGNSGSLGAGVSSVAQMLHRVGVESVLASRYPLSVSGSIRLTEAFFRTLMTSTVDAAFLAAREALAVVPSALDWASLQLLGHISTDVERSVSAAARTAAVTKPAVTAAAPETATFFTEPDYLGASCELGLGSHDVDALEASLGNDEIASVKVPRGLRIRLFDDCGFEGTCEVLDADAPEIFLSRQVSSLRVERHGIVVFARPNFEGASLFLPLGERRPVDFAIRSARVPSGLRLCATAARDGTPEPTGIITDDPELRIAAPCEVSVERFGARLFEFESFLGRSQVLGIGRHDLSALALGNDAIRSIRIPAGLLVTVYEDVDFEGPSLSLTSDAADIPIGVSSLIIAPQLRLRRA